MEAQEITRLAAELSWREGRFSTAHDFYSEYIEQTEASDTFSMVSIAGNSAHAAGLYAEAEKLLSSARDQTIRGPRPLRQGRRGWLYPERSIWVASLDLGLLFLTEGKFEDSIHEFDEALTALKRRGTGLLSDLVELTYICKGYAHFKNQDTDGAAHTWLSAALGDHTEDRDEGSLQAELDTLLTKDCLGRSDDPENIVRLLIRLGRNSEAMMFVRDNELEAWVPGAYFHLLASQGALDEVETAFSNLIRRRRGTVSSQVAPFAALSSVLNSNAGWQALRLTIHSSLIL